MNAVTEQPITAAVLPELSVPNADLAISLANRWLHRNVGLLIHVSRAVFDPVTCGWRLPVELSYPRTGLLGVIGDIYLNAAGGQFIGLPTPEELQQRATALAHAYGFREEDDADDKA